MKLSKKEKEVKLMLYKSLVNELPKMSLEELKDNYIYMLEDPFFTTNYKYYTSDIVNKFTEKDKENLMKYFLLGLNMYKTKIENASCLDLLLLEDELKNEESGK